MMYLAKQRRTKLDEITAGGTKMADITATQFKSLIFDGLESKVDYGIVVEYTALPERFGCKKCESLHEDMGYIAKAHDQGDIKLKTKNFTPKNF